MSTKNQSTGPRTPMGKSIVSKNAVKSGVYSSAVLLPNESKTDYEHLKNLFWVDLKPCDHIEETLVNDLVQLAWKKRRLDQFEQTALLGRLNAPISEAEIADCPKLSTIGLEAARQLFSMSEGERVEYLQAYQLLQSLFKQKEIRKNDFSLHNMFLTGELEAYLERIELSKITGNKDAKDFVQELNMRLKPTHSFEPHESQRLRLFVANTMETMQSKINYLQRYDELLVEWEAIRDRRYLGLVETGNLSRAHDDLRRAFYKALQEFRKHRHWKQMSLTISLPSTET